jgi:hypothetical protein
MSDSIWPRSNQQSVDSALKILRVWHKQGLTFNCDVLGHTPEEPLADCLAPVTPSTPMDLPTDSTSPPCEPTPPALPAPTLAQLFDYALYQWENGPCGVLAAVHASLLRELLFPSPSRGAMATELSFAARARQALVDALADAIWRCRSDAQTSCSVLTLGPTDPDPSDPLDSPDRTADVASHSSADEGAGVGVADAAASASASLAAAGVLDAKSFLPVASLDAALETYGCDLAHMRPLYFPALRVRECASRAQLGHVVPFDYCSCEPATSISSILSIA